MVDDVRCENSLAIRATSPSITPATAAVSPPIINASGQYAYLTDFVTGGPTRGLWFGSAIQAGNWPLALIGVLASVVAAYAYLRVVVRMYFRPAKGEIEDDRSLVPQLAGLVLAVTVVVLGVFPRIVSGIIEQASILRW